MIIAQMSNSELNYNVFVQPVFVPCTVQGTETNTDTAPFCKEETEVVGSNPETVVRLNSIVHYLLDCLKM